MALAKKTSNKKFRKSSAELGYDLSDITDDELEKGILKAGVALSQSSVSASEAAKAFRLFGLAARPDR